MSRDDEGENLEFVENLKSHSHDENDANIHIGQRHCFREAIQKLPH